MASRWARSSVDFEVHRLATTRLVLVGAFFEEGVGIIVILE
jgi:hypothetical protein